MIAAINNRENIDVNILQEYLQNNDLNPIVAIASLFPISYFQKTTFYADLAYFMNFSKIYGQIDKNFTLDDLQWLALYLLTIAYKDFDIISQSSLLDYFSHLSQIPTSNNDSMIWI